MSARISALKVQQRNPRRVNVFIDGEFVFSLERITAGWLKVGQELTSQKIAELQAQDTQEVAYQKALRFLAYRPRTESEIRRSLSKKGISTQVTDLVIERLRQNGMVDDEQFAQMWIENRSEFRPRSRKALMIELRQQGISDELIHKALSSCDIDEEQLAYQAALKHSGKLMNLERIEFRRKLSGFLARRGFNYETIAPVIDRIWKELYQDKNHD